MKLLYILPILLGLCSCNEKPIYVQNNLWCVELANGAKEKATTNIQLYKNYAMVSVDGKITKLKINEKYIRDDNKFKSIQYGTDDNGLNFSVNVFEKDVRIGLILNAKPCLFPETLNKAGSEKAWPYNRYQTKKIDENTQKKLDVLFK